MATAPKPGSPAWRRQWEAAVKKAHKPPSAPISGKKAADAYVPPGWAKLAAIDDPALAVLTELGDRFPFIDGGPNWEEVERKGRKSLVTFNGFDAPRIEVDLVFDDFDADRSVHAATSTLELLSGAANTGTPPALRLNVGGGVYPQDWVIDDIAWSDDDTVRTANGIVRAACTVSLIEHVTDQRLQSRALKTRRQEKQRGKHARRFYTVKEGENLITIARRRLGDAGRWVEIAKLNGIRDPRAVKAGARIRLP